MSQKPSEITGFSTLLEQGERLLQKLAQLLPPVPVATDWSTSAFRWMPSANRPGHGHLESIPQPHQIGLDDLLGQDRPKQALLRNTQQFLAGQPANHALLWGPRGTGKSSLIKALLTEFASQGLRIIEVDKSHLVDLAAIAAAISERRENFILFCDDLAFDAGDPAYRPLKVALDGSLNGPRPNLLIYATSNRRHLLPEYMQDNEATSHQGTEIHFSETVEETISLSERFGLWLSFHAFDQDQYLAAVEHWLTRLNGYPETKEWPACRELALRWALQRGSRSGRSAHQFARDYTGRNALP